MEGRKVASHARRSAGAGFSTTSKRNDARDNGPRYVRNAPACPNANCSVMSATTRSFAVAVVHSTATPAGSCSSMSWMRR